MFTEKWVGYSSTETKYILGTGLLVKNDHSGGGAGKLTKK